MKAEIADTIKWGLVDKVASQLLYAVTGVVLARMLTPDDFGLVGAVMVFQAFASLFVDSGFSSALIQRKHPDRLDYSTVMWFNIAMACAIYVILFACAPLIASWFQGDERLVPLSRVMFLSFIVTATTIVPTNRFMKQMHVKMIAVANSAGLVAGAIIGIYLAVRGYGAWAVVWQTITLAAVKSVVLWWQSDWAPMLRFSWQRLRSFVSVGMGVMSSSFLNTVFQNIYSFFIGNRAGLGALGYYTQADKWSKMGVMSLSQALTQAFLPPLSELQDDPVRFARASRKMDRTASYLLFPAMGVLAVVAAPIFHLLFGLKWDMSIPLFRLLLLRGVFTILSSVYNGYVLSLGRSKLLVISEGVRDGLALAALIPMLPLLAMNIPSDPMAPLRWLLWGQVAASATGCAVTLYIASREILGMATKSPRPGATLRQAAAMGADSLPYLALTLIAMLAAWGAMTVMPQAHAIWQLAAGLAAAGTTYLGLNALLGSKVQREALRLLLKR